MKMDTTPPVAAPDITNTLDKLRQSKGYEHLTDKQTQTILQTIEALSQIAVQAILPIEDKS